MASFKPDSSEPLQQQHHTQHHQHHQHQQRQQEMIDIQGSRRHSSTGKNKMVVTTLDGKEEEIEVIGSGISSSFQPASDKGQRLPLKLPNLKYNLPESSVNNYSPGTSVVFNAYRGHGRLLTQPYAISSDNESDRPPEHTYQRLPGSQSQEWPQDPYRQHPHPQPLSPSHPYDSDGYPSYRQQHYPNYPSYHTPHDRPYHPYSSNNQDPRDPVDSRDTRDPPIDPRDYRDSRDFRDPREEPYGREFDSTHSRQGPPSPRIGSSGKPDDQEGRGRMGHYPPPHPRDSRVTQPPPMPHRLRSPHNALDPPHPKNAHSPYDDPVSSRYHPFPSQQRSPVDPWESSSEHRPPYPSAAIDIPQPPYRRSINTPSDYRRHEPLDNARSQHHNSYPHIPQQPPSSSSAGPSSYRDPFNPPRGEGPRYEFSRINYQMIFEYANEIRDCLIKGKVGTTDRLLYNAEILSKIFMGCRVDQEPIDHVEGEVTLNPHQLRCTSCNIVKTPEWRKGPLGPRTLCNACGLIWGKLSRSKAALAAKSKQESSTKAAESEMPATDSQTTAATTAGGVEIPKRPATDPITLTDIARKKRGRGRSTTRDDDEDTGSGIMLNGNEAPGSAGQNGSSSLFPYSNGQSGSQGQAEDVIMSGGVSPPPPQPSFRPSNGEPHTVEEGGCQIDPFLAAAGPVPSPQSPDTLPFSTQENHDKEGPVVGRKLNLSYLLA